MESGLPVVAWVLLAPTRAFSMLIMEELSMLDWKNVFPPNRFLLILSHLNVSDANQC